MTFKLYNAKGLADQYNTYYPNEKEINSEADLIEASRFDFVVSKFRDNERNKENFISCNALFADVDNGCSIEEFQEIFEGVDYYIQTSKSHRIEKANRIVDRFHVFFPLGREITNGIELEKLILKLQKKYSFFDISVKDCSRFFYGNPKTQVIYNEGKSIEDFLKMNIGIPSYFNEEDIATIKTNVSVEVGNRNTTLTSIAGKYRSKGLAYEDLLDILLDKNKTFSEPLPAKEVMTIAKSVSRYEPKSYKTKEELFDYFEELYFKTVIGNKVCVVSRNYPNTTEGIYDRKNFLEAYSSDAFKYVEEAPNGKNSFYYGAEYWFAQTKVYSDGLVFSPNEEITEKSWNLWKGYSYKANSNGKSKSFFDFIKNIICSGNEEHYNYLVSLMAHVVQFPEKKEGIVVALRGEQGIGKNFFIENFGKLFGNSYIEVLNSEALVGKFNKQLQNKLIVFADEIYTFFGGQDGIKSRNLLKGMITGNDMIIEMKGKDSYVAKNLIRFFFASNSEWVAPVENGDRRYFVLDVSSEKKENGEYFGSIYNDLLSGGYEDLLFELQSKDIFDFDFRKIPLTKAKSEQAYYTADPLIRFLVDAINEGIYTTVSGRIKDIPSSDLLNDYNAALKTPINATSLGIKMKKILGDCVNKKRFGTTDRTYAYQFKTVEEVKARLEEYSNIALPWNDI